MMPRTPARMIAESMEEEQVAPLERQLRKLRETKVDREGGLGPLRSMVKGITGAAAPSIEMIEKMVNRPRRSEEEMSELTREVGRGDEQHEEDVDHRNDIGLRGRLRPTFREFECHRLPPYRTEETALIA